MKIWNVDGYKLRDLVARAFATTDAIVASGQPPSAAMADIFRKVDLVWGVWPQVISPSGGRVAILKGEGRLLLIAQSKNAKAVREAVFRFRDETEAETACQIYGDDRSQAA